MSGVIYPNLGVIWTWVCVMHLATGDYQNNEKYLDDSKRYLTYIVDALYLLLKLNYKSVCYKPLYVSDDQCYDKLNYSTRSVVYSMYKLNPDRSLRIS